MVGASGRYPHAEESGGLAGFWQHILQNTDVPTGIPLQRWDIERYYSAEEPGQPGMMYLRLGSFMSNIDDFDNALFR
jgi:acyl transferase domain-containing protein